jgi:hypothetical protein
LIWFSHDLVTASGVVLGEAIVKTSKLWLRPTLAIQITDTYFLLQEEMRPLLRRVQGHFQALFLVVADLNSLHEYTARVPPREYWGVLSPSQSIYGTFDRAIASL